MKIAFFVTCLVDQFFPEVGEAAIKVLKHIGIKAEFPKKQTCCGQPAFNMGYRKEAASVAERTMKILAPYDYIIIPSGSCTSMIKVHYDELFRDNPNLKAQAKEISLKVFEFSEFLTDVLKIYDVGANYKGTVCYHDSCHSLRELKIKEGPRKLIGAVKGITLKELKDSEACCGFGGIFAVNYPHLSVSIMHDKIKDLLSMKDASLVTNDVSCLMQITGGLKKLGLNIRTMHLAELLASR